LSKYFYFGNFPADRTNRTKQSIRLATGKKDKKMVRPRGLDKAAEPLPSQPEHPAGNPTKKSA